MFFMIVENEEILNHSTQVRVNSEINANQVHQIMINKSNFTKDSSKLPLNFYSRELARKTTHIVLSFFLFIEKLFSLLLRFRYSNSNLC